MTSRPQSETKPAAAVPALVLWIIWFVQLCGVILLQVFLGGGIPSGRNPPDTALHPVLWVGLALVAASTMIRWRVLPRFAELAKKLVWMIIGLALSESAAIFSIFLVPRLQAETKVALLMAGLVGMLQFVPVYANEQRR